MQIREAEWIGEWLAGRSVKDLSPILNLGSSTGEFRELTQPHMQRCIFGPLRERSVEVVHSDIKHAPGVDLVGDLTDPAFQQELRQLRPRCVLVNNILHHIHNRAEIVSILPDLIGVGGYLVLSGPHRFPRHYDPFDTMYRPSVEQVVAEFSLLEAVESAIIDSGNWRQWRAEERGQRSLSRALVRTCLPVYKPKEWWRLAIQAPYFLKHISAFCVVFRQPQGDPG